MTVGRALEIYGIRKRALWSLLGVPCSNSTCALHATLPVAVWEPHCCLFRFVTQVTVTAGCLYLQAQQVRELGECVILQPSQIVPWQVPETQCGVTLACSLRGLGSSYEDYCLLICDAVQFSSSLQTWWRAMLHWTDWRHGIPEALGSNFGRDTGYPDWGFMWFSSVTPGKCRDGTSI
jgi:hypothetical protein